MDCETCHDLLLDLAYGELDEVRAAAARKHTDGCNDCRQSLRRISRGRSLARQLPLEPAPAPSPALLAAIEAAASQASRVSAPPQQGTPPLADGDAMATGGPEHTDAPRPGRAMSRWLERVGEIAMRRQVAMAAVFLLTIGVGLVFYQTHPRPTDLPDDRAPDVVPAEEVPGSPTARNGEGHASVPRGAGSVAPVRPGAERDEQRAHTTAPIARPSSEMQERTVAHESGSAPARIGSPAPARADEALAVDSDPSVRNNAAGAPTLTNAAVPAGAARYAAPPPSPAGELAQQPAVPATQSAAQGSATAQGVGSSATENGQASLDAAIRQLQDAIGNTGDPRVRLQYRTQLSALLRRRGNIAGAEAVEAEIRASVEVGSVQAAAPAPTTPPVAASASTANAPGPSVSGTENTGANLQLRARRAHTPRPASRRASPDSNYAAPMEAPSVAPSRR